MMKFSAKISQKNSFIAIFALPLIFVGLTAKADVSPENDAAFERFFPYYSETCVVGENTRDGNKSGTFGHEVLYLKGACPDKDSHYPKVKMCDQSPGSSGVGISLDGAFVNTLFVATPGKDLLFNTGIKSDEPFDKKAYDQAIQNVVDSGSLEGIEVGKSFFENKPAETTNPQWIARTMMGTDFGISLGRNAYCLRVPMNRAQISAEVDFLNNANAPYVAGKDTLDWSLLGTNCATLVHNTLHEVGVRALINGSPTRWETIKELFRQDLPIPTNDFSLDEKAIDNLKKVDIAEKVFANKESRELFNRFQSLPQGSPTLIEYLPYHGFQNEIYVAGPLRWLEIPVVQSNAKRLDKMSKDPRYGTVQGSIERVLERFQSVQAARKEIKADADPAFVSFAHNYNAWIDRSVQELSDQLNSIRQ